MKPAIVIVHGGFHVPAHFDKFADRLRSLGHEVNIPRLPSSGPLEKNCELADDIKVVRDAVLALADEGKKVIVVGHSYGGVVAGEALNDTGIDERKQQGLPGGTVHLIYMCAFLVQPSESVPTVDPQGDPPTINFYEDGTCFAAQSPRHLFYQDVDEAVAKEAEDILVLHATVPLATPASAPAWPSLPTSYFECTQDQMLSIEKQRGCIQRAQATGKVIEVESFKSGHSPWLSLPEETAAAIEKIAARYS